MEAEGSIQRIQANEKTVGLEKNNVTVVLPVLNEEAGVKAVIDEVSKNGYTNILVVDGYSTDNTAQVARELGAEVVEQHGRGKTGAIITAIENVSTPFMLVMDGDYTYNAADVQRFLSHATEYNYIVGSRQQENIKPLHRLGNRIISMVFNLLFFTTVSDVCSGMYLMKLNAARRLTLHTKGFSVEAELLAQMSFQGRITEVPISYRKRIGEPKLVTWKHGFDIMKTILGLARIYNPVFLFSILAASAAIPGLVILTWVVWAFFSLPNHPYHGAWALAGLLLLVLASQAFIVGTISLLIRRSELRLEHLLYKR